MSKIDRNLYNSLEQLLLQMCIDPRKTFFHKGSISKVNLKQVENPIRKLSLVKNIPSPYYIYIGTLSAVLLCYHFIGRKISKEKRLVCFAGNYLITIFHHHALLFSCVTLRRSQCTNQSKIISQFKNISPNKKYRYLLFLNIKWFINLNNPTVSNYNIFFRSTTVNFAVFNSTHYVHSFYHFTKNYMFTI